MRVPTLDLLKIFSIYFVIVSHVVFYFLETETPDIWLYLLRQLGQLGVTLFFMCSGYFILNNKQPDQVSYILEKIKKISLILIYWLIIYFCYDRLFISHFTEIQKFNLLAYINVRENLSGASPLWFIFALINLYLLTPFIRGFFNTRNIKGIRTLIIILFCIANLTLVNALTKHFFGFSSFPSSLLTLTQAQGLISFLIGGYLGITPPDRTIAPYKRNLIIVVSVISFLLLVRITLETGMDLYYFKFYNLPLQLSALGFFYVAISYDMQPLTGLWADISKKTLGIFLTHNLFVVEMYGGFIHDYLYGKFFYLNNCVYILIYSLLAFLLAYILSFIILRFKITARLLAF